MSAAEASAFVEPTEWILKEMLFPNTHFASLMVKEMDLQGYMTIKFKINPSGQTHLWFCRPENTAILRNIIIGIPVDIDEVHLAAVKSMVEAGGIGLNDVPFEEDE